MITCHVYRTMRNAVQAMDATLPGKFEIAREGIIHDLAAPNAPHELTRSHLRKRLEKVMPHDLVAHTGTPDVEDESAGVMRRPDVMLIAAIEVVSRSNPDNDWVGKMRDYPLLGIPVYVIFDPRTGEGAVLSDIHSTPSGPRYATRKDFIYGEDVTIAEWTISTADLPRYPGKPGGQHAN